MATSIGWDASTAIVGVSAVTEGRTLCWQDHIDLRKIEHLNDKLICVRQFIRDNAERLKSLGATKHFVEDRLGSFSFGKTSQQTLMKLAAFNAMVCFVIEDETQTRPIMLHPATIKARLKPLGLVIPKGGDKKEITLAWVQAREKSFMIDLNRNDKHQPWNIDEADAYCIALAGQIVSLTS